MQTLGKPVHPTVVLAASTAAISTLETIEPFLPLIAFRRELVEQQPGDRADKNEHGERQPSGQIELCPSENDVHGYTLMRMILWITTAPTSWRIAAPASIFCPSGSTKSKRQ